MDNYEVFPSMIRKRCLSENERSPPANEFWVEMTAHKLQPRPIDHIGWNSYWGVRWRRRR
jgi:hypothetical protein